MLQRNSDYMPVSEEGRTVAAGSQGRASGDVVNLRSIAQVFWRRWPTIALCTALAVGLAVAFLTLVTPLYTSTVTVLIDPRRENVVDSSQSVLTSFGTDDGAVDSQIQLLQSLATVRRVVERLNLADDPEFGPKKKLFETVTPEQAGNTASDNLQRQVKVTRVAKSFVAEVSVTSRDPAKASNIANAIADGYLLDQVTVKNNAAKLAAAWLDRQLGELKQRVIDSDQAVEKFRAANNLTASQGVTVNDAQITSLSNELVSARVQSAEARAAYEQVASIIKQGIDPGSLGEALSSPLITQLRTQYAEIAKNEADITSKYGARHPSVANVRAQRRDIQRQINDAVKRTSDGLRNAYQVALAREQSLEKQLEGLKGVANDSRQSQIRLRQLQREADANRSLYEAFLARYKETSAQESLHSADSRIVSAAKISDVPSFPKTVQTLALSVALGLAFGTILAFFIDFLDRRIKTPQQLGGMTGIANIASVPLLSARQRKASKQSTTLDGEPGPAGAGIMRHIVHEPMSIFAEAIRTIRLEIQRASRSHRSKIVMITSGVPNEGKSTIASNVALSFASIGLRTILVDTDMRNPNLTRALTPNAKGGLAEVATAKADLAAVIATDASTGLFFLPAAATGTVVGVELIGSEGVRRTLARLRESFDVVVIDPPPLLPLIDGRALAEQVDHIVLVVAWDRTPPDIVEQTMELLAPYGDRIVGSVLSQVDLHRMRYYDYYRSSAYLKNYAKYYNEKAA